MLDLIRNISPQSAGEYNLIIYSQGGCEDAYLRIRVVVTPVAKASASASTNPVNKNKSVYFTSSSGLSHSWTGPLGFTSYAQNPPIKSVTRYQAGIYVVGIENENGYISTAKVNQRVLYTNKGNQNLVSSGNEDPQAINILVEEGDNLYNAGVYPNPMNDVFYFELSGNEAVEYSIYNAMGDMIVKHQTANDRSFSTSSLPYGLYRSKDSEQWNNNKSIKLK